MKEELGERLFREKPTTSEGLMELFLDWAMERGLELYPAQEAAVLELFDGKNVILKTPTGSGKSLVASALLLHALGKGHRAAYTCPIKALVNEKWMDLCRVFGPEQVGLSTGDATVNGDAPILCCTAEILSNMALRDGEDCSIKEVVMDEFHYYSDRDRGVAWQVPLLTLPKARFLLMSATLGNTTFLEKDLRSRCERETVAIEGDERPVPLKFSYNDENLPLTVQELVDNGKAPLYVVHFAQAEAATNAQSFTSLNLVSKEERKELAEHCKDFRFSSPHGPDIKRWLRQGVGIHHAGLLPKYRILVERLAQKGLLKVICGTDTLGVGVNVPIRTVLFTKLCKYGGDGTKILTARDFHQIAGRAGRRGFDDVGFVVAQAPEHVIDNLKAQSKSKKTGKKVVKRKAPERGYVPWDNDTLQKLIASQPEPMESKFHVSHSMIMLMLARESDGCMALRRLIEDSHETPIQKKEHRRRAFQLFRSLVEHGVINILPVSERLEGGAKVHVNANLQTDFSMHQTLSLFLLNTLAALDENSSNYHLELISVVESILENPAVILRKQLDRAKGDRIAELKAEGMEYEERMLELEKVEYPKPMEDFLYECFNGFAKDHPWLEEENVRPKSIVREMLEDMLTFSGYIKRYGLQRSEGLLLRHINNAYKVLLHTVPVEAKNDLLLEAEEFLGEMIRRTDSSLMDEWERMQNPEFVAVEHDELQAPGAPLGITADHKSFLASIRSRIFSWLSCLQRSNYQEAIDLLLEDLPEGEHPVDEEGSFWSAERLQKLVEEYRGEHGLFRLDPEGRALRYTHVEKSEHSWAIEQLLQDHEELNDWSLRFTVSLQDCDEAQAPLLKLQQMGPMDY
jgi:superfamily II RNA helicase